jgi:cell division protein FtsL
MKEKNFTEKVAVAFFATTTVFFILFRFFFLHTLSKEYTTQNKLAH